MARLHKSFLFGLTAATILVGGFNTASAQWNPAKQISDAAKRLEKSIHTEGGRLADSVKRAHQLNYVVRISNPTNSYLKYNFNGQSQIPIPPRRVVTFRGTKAGHPTIAFGNGRRQTVRYSLPNGNYRFEWGNGTLQLHRG